MPYYNGVNMPIVFASYMVTCFHQGLPLHATASQCRDVGWPILPPHEALLYVSIVHDGEPTPVVLYPSATRHIFWWHFPMRHFLLLLVYWYCSRTDCRGWWYRFYCKCFLFLQIYCHQRWIKTLQLLCLLWPPQPFLVYI